MTDRPRSQLVLYLALGYTLLILYASLSPFTGWRDPGIDAIKFILEPWPRYVSEFDLAINVLAYVPLGFLVTLLAMSVCSPKLAAICGTFVGVTISLALECAQSYLPGRVSANVDIATNALGALLGAVVAARAGSQPVLTRRLAHWRERWFFPDRFTDLGIALIALWFFSQLDPSLPLLGIMFFSDGVQAQLAGLAAGDASKILGPLSVAMNLVAVGLMLMLVMRSARTAITAVAALVWVAAFIKLIAATVLLRTEAAFLWVSQDVALALAAGAVFVGLAAMLPRHAIRAICAIALVAQIAISVLKPGETFSFLSLRLFRWTYIQLLHYTGLAAAVAEIWPYAALVYLALQRRRDRRPAPAPASAQADPL